MITFKEAEKVRIALKMKLSNYSWYKYSTIVNINNIYNIIITVSTLDTSIRKIIPFVIDNVIIKVELDK